MLGLLRTPNQVLRILVNLLVKVVCVAHDATEDIREVTEVVI